MPGRNVFTSLPFDTRICRTDGDILPAGDTLSVTSVDAPYQFMLPGLRLYAGQPDPADASHFTIRYESKGSGGTIDGWLRDGDSVKLQVRDGPAK